AGGVLNARDARRRAATDELIDRVALEEFDAAHGKPELAPIAVVIAAYKEAANIANVMAGMPKQVADLDASVVVVVDGEDDGTGAIVRESGHYACIAPVNRGQGAALRLGYRVAREHGARYIVTADADGQTDPDDLATVIGPVVAGELDFVNGSRRLGRTESKDAMRNAGVLFFGKLVSLLTATRVTDTANPIRAMRADVSGRLTLEEPQYQASELLISAIMHGYRFGERPVTMLARKEGASKKGGNFSYGYRYGRVLMRTWLRERARVKQELASG
ncbi:MAG TPA: glycosyltransferase family 2 protein, partial [Acidimicrobiales bacterium]|nr:glycosyltransferase family 2 protein [Acidimicrobiales bacterium]